MSGRVVLVVGARPNFMKAAPLKRALGERGVDVQLVHTGQHFDDNMSRVFFDELGLPAPDAFLGVGGGGRVAQFSEIVRLLGAHFQEHKPDRVLVVGDVTSTAAGAVAADCLDLPVDHVEAGLRSFDLTMPEERNRRMTDSLADLLFVSEGDGVRNLQREGARPEQIHHVGNVMIDTLERFRTTAEKAAPWEALGLSHKGYAVLTAHRPANVDTTPALESLVRILTDLSERMPVVFPVHPRTRKRLQDNAPQALSLPRVIWKEPLGYLEFLGLVAGCRVAVTDSGGLQEETTVLGVPCVVLRENTERPAALTSHGGSSTLTGLDPAKVAATLDAIGQGRYPQAGRPPLWDGRAGDRIADLLCARLG